MSQFDRRDLLAASLAGLGGVLLTNPASGQWFTSVPKDGARPDTLFLTWQRDPTTTMTIQWIGKAKDYPKNDIYYAPLGPTPWAKVTPRVAPFPLQPDYQVFRAELTDLFPGTEYHFGIGSWAKPYRFRTMPARLTDAFTFVSGGDCGVNPHALANNVMAAKQDPYFALIGGDLGYDNGKSAGTALEFQRNYSKSMIDGKGRLNNGAS